MGKKNNIKSARKLIDAKRKREQEALMAAGLAPAVKALNKQVTQNGGIILPNLGVKYSKLLEVFVAPMLRANDDITSIKTKCTIAAKIWNAAIKRQKSEKEYQKEKKDLVSLIPEMEEFFNEMVMRKNEEFSGYNNIFVDVEVEKKRGGDFKLTVKTTRFDN